MNKQCVLPGFLSRILHYYNYGVVLQKSDSIENYVPNIS